MKASVFDLLWVGEVVVDLLVEDVKYYIQEIPAKLYHKVAIKTTIENKDFMTGSIGK